MGRRTALASLAGGEVEDVPGQSDVMLLRVLLTQLVPTRFNPRRTFGTEEQLREFGLVLKKRQLQPAVVVSRAAYLKLWPEEAESVGSVPYVIANGERRYRGSIAAGLTHLDVVHREEVAKSRADFLDAVMSENNDREDLDPIERAIGIETMVIELGGARQVAEHYTKHESWVSQQRKLLKLTPGLQALVSSGEMPVRVAREIAGLATEDQEATWAAELERREAAKALPRVRRAPAGQAPVPARQGRNFTAVKPDLNRQAASIGTEGASPAVDTEPRDFTAVKSREASSDPADDSRAPLPRQPVASPTHYPVIGTGGSEQASPAPGPVPDGAAPDHSAPDGVQVEAMPWDNPVSVLSIASTRMTPANFERLLEQAAQMVNDR